MALYDKKTGKTTSIFSKPFSGAKETTSQLLTARWESKGDRVLAAWGEDEPKAGTVLHVVQLAPGADKPLREYKLPGFDKEGLPYVLVSPLVELDGKLFVGGPAIARLDLATGQVKRQPLPRGKHVCLAGSKPLLYCLETDDSNELGTLDPDDLSLKPLLTLKRDPSGPPALIFAAIQRDGATIAFPRQVEEKVAKKGQGQAIPRPRGRRKSS